MCTIRRNAARGVISILIAVIFSPLSACAVKILAPRNREVVMLANESVALRCEIPSSPLTTLDAYWTKDGKIVASKVNSVMKFGARYRMPASLRYLGFHLVLLNLSIADEGVYRCMQARRYPGKYLRLRVITPPRLSIARSDTWGEEIVTADSRRDFNRYKPLTVVCRANGARPSVSISWMLNYMRMDPLPVTGVFSNHVMYGNVVTNVTAVTRGQSRIKFFNTVSVLKGHCTYRGDRLSVTCKAGKQRTTAKFRLHPNFGDMEKLTSAGHSPVFSTAIAVMGAVKSSLSWIDNQWL